MRVDSLFGVSSDFSASYRSHQITVGRCFSTCSDYWGFIIFRIANCRNEPPVCRIIHHSESLHTASGFISGLFADIGNLLQCGIAVLLVNTVRLKWVMEVYACWYCVSDQLSVRVCVWSVTWAHTASVLVFWDSCVGCFPARVQQRERDEAYDSNARFMHLWRILFSWTPHTHSHIRHTLKHTLSRPPSDTHPNTDRFTELHTHCSSYCTCQKTLTFSLDICNKHMCTPDTQSMCTCTTRMFQLDVWKLAGQL